MSGLTESYLRDHVWPRFSRVLSRETVYLANHSLGRPLDRMADDLAEFARLWSSELDEAWTVWIAASNRFTDLLETLIGATPGTIAQRASAGQGLRSILNSFPQTRPIRVVTTTAEFDSIDTVLRAYAEAGRAVVEWVPLASTGHVPVAEPDEILKYVERGADLVVVSHVYFGTGHIFPDIRAFNRRCKNLGALVLNDLYHSVGAMPVDVTDLSCDFAIGGSYKYLRGGPGAGWLYVSPDVLKSGRSTLDVGWFGKSDTFDYTRSVALARKPGIAGWAESTPPVVATYQALSGLEFTMELGADAIRSYSLERQAMMRDILRYRGVPAIEPEDPDTFGAFSLVKSADPKTVCSIAAMAGLTVDSRGPYIRLCPDILNSVTDFEQAAKVLKASMA